MQAGAGVPLLGSLALDSASRSAGRPITPRRHMSTTRPLHHLITEPNQLRPEVKKLYDQVREFVQEECIPAEKLYHDHEDNREVS